MKWFVLFLLAFTQYFLATLEIAKISQGKVVASAIIAALSCSSRFLVTIIIIEEPDRIVLFVPYVLADVLATMLGVKLGHKTKSR